MDWIKRNLAFVIVGVLALVLLGGAGWYLYRGVSRNAAALEALNQEYATLERLNRQNPHPGNDKIDNIAAARAQEQEVRAFSQKMQQVFRPIPPIPPTANLNNAAFAEGLRRTLDRLQRDARDAGVQLPERYDFSFTAIRPLLVFDTAGLAPLAQQVGEVKAICDVLFAAKINALDNIRRVRVASHDREAQQFTDYTDRTPVTNDVAVLTPYEVTIRCFSSELSAVLAGFATSRSGMIVKAINVEPALATGLGTDPMLLGTDLGQPMVPRPVPGMPGEVGGGFRPGMPGMPGAFGQPQPTVTPTPTPAPGGLRGGLPVLLDEKQFKATLLIEVVRLNPAK